MREFTISGQVPKGDFQSNTGQQGFPSGARGLGIPYHNFLPLHQSHVLPQNFPENNRKK